LPETELTSESLTTRICPPAPLVVVPGVIAAASSAI